MTNETKIASKIETGFDSNYRKVLVAARRARQLQGGSHALVASDSSKFCRIAQDEIEAGKIAYVKKEIPTVKPLVGESGIPILS
jgi:DNA-directed RNA polymerase subunit omega